MCDYSLQNIASRAAKIGDKLVSTKFFDAITRGFAAVESPGVAVCLLPGTEIAFEADAQYDHLMGDFRNLSVGAKVAIFRKVDPDKAHVHHDALEFPNGTILLLTELSEGQRATVLQLPAAPGTAAEPKQSVRNGAPA